MSVKYKQALEVALPAAGIGFSAYFLHQLSRLVPLPAGLYHVAKYLVTGSREAVFWITEGKDGDPWTEYAFLVQKELYSVLDSAKAGSKGYTGPAGGMYPDVKPNPGLTARQRALMWCLSRVNSIADEDKLRKIRGRTGVVQEPPTNFLGRKWYYIIVPKGADSAGVAEAV